MGKLARKMKPIRAKRARGLYLSDSVWNNLSNCDNFPQLGRSQLAECAINHFLACPVGSQYEIVGKYLQSKNPKNP